MKFSQKGRPTYDLSSIRAAFDSAAKLRMTVSARKSATALGFSDLEVVSVIQELSPTDFHKSMTSHADNKTWQDVYHYQYNPSLTLYLKFTLHEDGHIVLSFKEK